MSLLKFGLSLWRLLQLELAACDYYAGTHPYNRAKKYGKMRVLSHVCKYQLNQAVPTEDEAKLAIQRLQAELKGFFAGYSAAFD